MKIKKIIAIIAIILTLLSIFANYKISKASETEKINLYAKEKLQCLIYKGMLVRNEFVVYNKDGIEYPAYCLNRELDGVSVEKGGYAVEVNKSIDNTLVWRAITNGYPYKTYESLGCNNEIEAFAATKMAVYDMLYNYDWNDFKSANSQGDRVLKAAKNIASTARNLEQEKKNANIKIQAESQQWKLENGTNISKTYCVTSDSELDNFVVNINDINVKFKILDNENKERNVFKNGENFKIVLPIIELKNSGKFKIEVSSNLKTYPVYYGESTVANHQNYAITGVAYEKAIDQIEETYEANKTSIEINKQDADTLENLEGCVFSLTTEKGEVLHENLITDKDGKIYIENLLPGKYFIKEEKAIDGYMLNNEAYQVELTMNKQEKIIVKNNKIKEEKLQEKQEEKQPEKIEIKLPKTGF